VSESLHTWHPYILLASERRLGQVLRLSFRSRDQLAESSPRRQNNPCSKPPRQSGQPGRFRRRSSASLRQDGGAIVRLYRAELVETAGNAPAATILQGSSAPLCCPRWVDVSEFAGYTSRAILRAFGPKRIRRPWRVITLPSFHVGMLCCGPDRRWQVVPSPASKPPRPTPDMAPVPNAAAAGSLRATIGPWSANGVPIPGMCILSARSLIV
jgi:hypothetical protein